MNEFGEVIGISTAIRADAEGIGFAIPINTAKLICARLAEGTAVRHPYLGIQARISSKMLLSEPTEAPLPALLCLSLHVICAAALWARQRSTACESKREV